MKKILTSKYISFYISGLVLVALVALYFVSDPFQNFIHDTVDVLLSEDTERTKNYFEEFGLWGPIVLILFIIFQMFLIVFPSWLPIIVAVMAYGLWLGVLISLTGVFLASTIGYYIGRKLKGAILNRIFGEEKMEKMDFWISNYAYGSVVLFRISPFLSNDGISFIAGMLQMKYRKFMAATMTGMVPLAFAIGLFSEDIDTLENGMYWIGGAGLVFYGIYIYIDYKKRRKKD